MFEIMHKKYLMLVWGAVPVCRDMDIGHFGLKEAHRTITSTTTLCYD